MDSFYRGRKKDVCLLYREEYVFLFVDVCCYQRDDCVLRGRREGTGSITWLFFLLLA